MKAYFRQRKSNLTCLNVWRNFLYCYMQTITTINQICHIENMQDLIWSCQMTVNFCQIFSLQTGYQSFVTCFWTSAYHKNINNNDVVSSIVALASLRLDVENRNGIVCSALRLPQPSFEWCLETYTKVSRQNN